MVNGRASSFHFQASARSRFLARTSRSSVPAFIFLLFAFYIFVFIFSPKQTADDDATKPTFTVNSQQVIEDQLWNSPFNDHFYPCIKPTNRYEAPQNWDRYITVRSNGGLNQMRTGISDMVAVARIMNATLVIPQLDKRSFWQDSSTFTDIFNERHFISTLKGDVRIVKQLPKELESASRARKHFTTWSSMSYYEEMTQLWRDYQVIHVPKSDSRLANNGLPLDIQRLRCRTLYEALRFSPQIENMGKKLVERLKSHGRYIALHLRYEKDMLSFTGCAYGLTETEAEELRIMRENTNHWKMKKINSTEQRIGGYCPLTPKEVGIFLQALGYPPSTWIYIAAGEIYGGDLHLLELRSRFPNLVFKETVATPDELKSFANHASQTAALDYIVSIESDVFVPSYSGNMARAVEGHRRFLGHRKTISPYRKGLVEVFDKIERGELKEGSSSLSSLVTRMHKFRQGKAHQEKERVLFQVLKGVVGLELRKRSMKIHFQNAYVIKSSTFSQCRDSTCGWLLLISRKK